MRFDNFSWSPFMTMGLFFHFEIFSINVWDTPTIPFGENGPFDAVPLGWGFTVATDPLSPVNDPWYLYQPPAAQVLLSVAPAQTALSITSGNVLTEGKSVTVRLSEKYDGSPIAGHMPCCASTIRGATAPTLAMMHWES